MSENQVQRILVTGGTGYIGSVLVPRLAAAGHHVTVLDALHFGFPRWPQGSGDTSTRIIRGDIRDAENVTRLLREGHFDTVIHLAAIANDPCADLDEALSISTNLDAVIHLMREAKNSEVRRFLYASSASVYGVKEEADVVESLPLDPITIYARLKAECEGVLNELAGESFCGVSVRAATVCGDSPRLRLDLTVNLLTHQASCLGKLRVFGGSQERPNVHVVDLARFYETLLVAPTSAINGQAFNACRENASVMSLAERVRDAVDKSLGIEIVPTEDRRSYRLSAEKARRILGFEASHSLGDAIAEVKAALHSERIADPDAACYRNVAFMQENASRWAQLTEWKA